MDYLRQLVTEMHVEEEEHVSSLKNELSFMRDVLVELISTFKGLKEDAQSAPYQQDGDVKELLQRAIDRFNAAKRAMGLVNQLQPGDTKARHIKRVMGNLNKLRPLVSSLKKMMNVNESANEIISEEFHPDFIKFDSSKTKLPTLDLVKGMGYKRDKKTTDMKSSHVWDTEHHDASVFKKKGMDPLLVKPNGDVYDYEEGRYVHPLRHKEIYDHLNAKKALVVMKLQNGRSVVDLNREGLKKMGLAVA